MENDINKDVDVTILIPAYNEEVNIVKCIEQTNDTMKKLNYKFEILVMENGSTDKTFEILQKLATKYENLYPFHLPIPNPSQALKEGYANAKGNTVVNLDVDLATDMRHMKELLEYAKTYDLVTGSRYLDKSLVTRTYDRYVLSTIFNKILIRGLLRSKILDNNCGFRAINRKMALNLIKDIEDDYVFGIVELIIRAQRKGYKIKEFPVSWKENPRRITLKNIMRFLVPALRLWVKLDIKREKY